MRIIEDNREPEYESDYDMTEAELEDARLEAALDNAYFDDY